MDRREKKIIGRRLLRSYVSSVISIALVLFLVGFFAILAFNAKGVGDYLKQNVKISVILQDTVSEKRAASLVGEIMRLEQVKAAEVISKEQGTSQMKALLGEDFLDIFEANPIPVSIDVSLEAGYFSETSVKELKTKLLQNKSIEDVVYRDSVITAMNRNIRNIGLVLAGFIILLMFISIVLINNTVRLNIFSRRFSIHTMQLVGATRGFIVRPFLSKAVWQGILSGLIALAALAGLMWLASTQFSKNFIMVSDETLAYIGGGIVILGVFICICCTSSVVRRITSMSVDDLYY